MAFSLTWLPDVLKDAGLKVAEVPGWKNLGIADMGPIKGVLCHHTGTASRSGNMPSLNTLIHGRTGENALRGPLAQLGLGRDGTYYIISAGKCNHAGPGEWQGITTGNTNFIGIEAENMGNARVDPWPDVQMDAYQRGVAAILKHINRGADFCIGHKEYRLPKGFKDDPDLDMDVFRTAVDDILNDRVVQPPLIPPLEPGNGGRATLRRGKANDASLVKIVQVRVGVKDDGFFGPKTEAAVRAFQAINQLVPDGIVGPKSWLLIDQA
jgi:peptidoglycan hydrolase-like protein with peptidoglycan-binding domain